MATNCLYCKMFKKLYFLFRRIKFDNNIIICNNYLTVKNVNAEFVSLYKQKYYKSLSKTIKEPNNKKFRIYH